MADKQKNIYILIKRMAHILLSPNILCIITIYKIMRGITRFHRISSKVSHYFVELQKRENQDGTTASPKFLHI